MSPVVIPLLYDGSIGVPGVQEFSSRAALQKRLMTTSLWIKWHLTFFCLRGSQKNPKGWFVGAGFLLDFFSSFLTMCLLLVNAARSHKWTEGGSTEGWDVSKILEKGWIKLGGEHRSGQCCCQGWSGFGASQVQHVCCVTNSGKILWCHFMHRN